MPDISVIVPVLDEEDALPELFDVLDSQQGVELEVIVADGGSGDKSREIAKARGAKVVSSEAGRGVQMNAGAGEAAADWLFFLHADSRPESAGQLSLALEAIREGKVRTAGHFGLRFTDRQSDAFLYRYMEAKTTTNRPYTINGDQGLLISREWFREIGGFDKSLPFLEDQRLARTIRDNGDWVLLPGRLNTSARRFESEGPYRRYLLMGLIMIMHAAGEEGFLRKTPELYRVQRDTEKLLITPYLRGLKQYFKKLPVGQRVRVWSLIGDFVVGQMWQIGFVFDVWLRRLLRGRRPFLFMYNLIIAPALQRRSGRTWAAICTYVVLFYILRPLFWFRERAVLRG